jgi:hypothetical protein
MIKRFVPSMQSRKPRKQVILLRHHGVGNYNSNRLCSIMGISAHELIWLVVIHRYASIDHCHRREKKGENIDLSSDSQIGG